MVSELEGGAKVVDVYRRLGVTDATVYNWKKRYAGMGVAEIRRLRQLEDENTRLKTLVADLTLDNQALKAVLGKRW